VKPINLSLELERAVISHLLEDDGVIYVNEPGWFPFWIRVRTDHCHVVLNTHTLFKRAVGKVQRLELCNEINTRYFLLTASMDAQRLRVDHTLLYRDGMTRETFIRACRTFNHNMCRAMSELDPDDSVVLEPGKDEEENIAGDSE
jgi:hypothetical protein